MSESYLEQKVRSFAIGQGMLCFKLETPGTDAIPDRMCIYRGNVLFLELKDKGKKPSEKQLYRMKQLLNAGVYVGWADRYNKAITIIQEFKQFVDNKRFNKSLCELN